MADTINIYSKDGKTKIVSGVSPLTITGLTPNTTYAAGSYVAVSYTHLTLPTT